MPNAYGPPGSYHPPRHTLPVLRRGLLGLLGLILALVAVQWFRPIPGQAVRRTLAATLTAPGAAVTPPWPAIGEAALAIAGLGMIGGQHVNRPVPIASLAKMMTAYLVLTDHPLSAGSSGPVLTITAANVATYQADAAGQQSVVAVQAGEQLTEAQALQALLIPSANNIADVLAAWDAGSIPAFVAKMNATAARLGLRHTYYTDPSGLAASTVSTAAEQLRLAELVMANPEFASIVAEPQVTLPVAGTVYNYDYEVGHDGFVGVKTGSDGSAGGCWVFAANRTIGGAQRMVYGVVLGQQGASGGLLQPALDAGRRLADAAPSLATAETVLPAGSLVGYLRAPWRAPVALRTTRPMGGLVAYGEELRVTWQVRVPSTRALAAGSIIGRVAVESSSSGVVVATSNVAIASDAPGPTAGWRLTRW